MPVDKRTESESGKGKRKKIRSSDVKGLKYFHVLRPLLKHLHDVGTKRDQAHNRHLFMDQYCILVLLCLYFPIVDSLRGLQQASMLKKVQQRFKLSKASLGSLSESVTVFDPEPLKRIAGELAQRLPEPAIPKSLQGLRTQCR